MTKDFSISTDITYDLLVIGGGINGAAVAHMAADNGLKVALVEKGDFASGTSSKSTKLAHGGLRYLERFELGLVKESLKERALLLKNAAHLVKPLRFIIPVYTSDPRPFWMCKFGVFLYDLLSGKHMIQKHRFLTGQDVLRELPGILEEGLVGGVMYYDAQMNDARLCLENVLSARAKGADVMNYCEVRALLKENGKTVGAQARDARTKEKFKIQARKVVCTVGPWANQIFRLDSSKAPHKIRTTKGIHVVYRRQLSDKALLLQVKRDKRVFFVIPWRDHSLIGTTDTDYRGDLNRVEATQEDIHYLLSEAQRVFPQETFHEADIVTTFAGLRPLVHGEGNPRKISRKHVIEQSYSGVYYVLGGKYTTYRKIAEDCLRKVYPDKKLNPSENFSVYGSGRIDEDSAETAKGYGLDLATVRHLKSVYGVRYHDVLQLVSEDEHLKEPICSCCPDILAQIVYSIRVELAQLPEDIIWRRLGLGYVPCQTRKCREKIEGYFEELSAVSSQLSEKKRLGERKD